MPWAMTIGYLVAHVLLLPPARAIAGTTMIETKIAANKNNFFIFPPEFP